MTLLTSCTSCDFMSIFGFEIPAQTDEYGTPIPPEYTKPTEETQTIIKETQKQTERPTDRTTAPPTKDNSQMTEEELKILSIQKAYWAAFKDYEKGRNTPYPDVQLLGEYNGAQAVYVLDTAMGGFVGVHYINGYEFRFRGERTIHLLKGGKFYPLKEALSKNIIDENDLASIYSEFHSINAIEYKRLYVEEGIPEDEIHLDRLVVYIQPQYNAKEYTADDFSDIGATDLDTGVIEAQESNQQKRRFTVYVPKTSREELIRLIRILEARDDIYWAKFSSNVPFTLDAVPNDTYYSEDNQWGLVKVGMPAAWDVTTGSPTVKVGIIDSGIDGTHPDLTGRVDATLSKSFVSAYTDALDDVHGHGTMVAGIIGAHGNNDCGISGVCWNVRLVSLRVVKENGDMDLDAVVKAIEYAEENDIKILNLSGSYSGSDIDDLKKAIDNYSGLLICTAGNSSAGYTVSIDISKVYPACFDNSNIIVVGSSNQNNSIDPTSNYGAVNVDLLAPGYNIMGCYPIRLCAYSMCGIEGTHTIGYHTKTGTSFAAPIVTGVAALILSKHPEYSRDMVRSSIIDNTTVIPELSGKCASSGILNADKAVNTHRYRYSIYNEGFLSAACIYCEKFLLQRHTNSTSCTLCGYDGRIIPVPGINSSDEETS